MFKILQINSIRSRMIVGFLLLTLLILVLAVISLLTLNRTIEIARVHSDINQLEIYTLNLIRNDNNFLELETANEAYFKTRTSSLLTTRDSLNNWIARKKSSLRKLKSLAIHQTVLAPLSEIDSSITGYNKTFHKLEHIIFTKGFRNFGLEGAMRIHAHELEKTGEVEIKDILLLRRHEKDFLLRHDTVYLFAFNNRASVLLTKFEANPTQYGQPIAHLKEYQRIFQELADLSRKIGSSTNIGLRHELNDLSASISEEFFRLSEFSYVQSASEHEKARILYIIILSGAIFISILSAYWISKRLTEPITWLSKLVNNTMESRSTTGIDLSLHNAADEVIVLTSSFKKLIDQTRLQLNEIEMKSQLLRKRNKELKRLNKELDQFLYSSAHDMRSPMSSLLGLINLAKLESNDQKIAPYLIMMENSVYRQEYFIDQIVSFSKNKITTLTPEKMEWKELISSILQDHQFVPGAQKIEKQVIVHSGYDFYSDKSRVTIILNNLISNAIRYADLEKASPYMRIEITPTNSEVVIDFSDNGIGIAQDHLAKIFKMFYRAHNHSKGSGLGLFIVYKTVERMKGTVLVKSEEKIGTTFLIRLPMLALFPVQHTNTTMHVSSLA